MSEIEGMSWGINVPKIVYGSLITIGEGQQKIIVKVPRHFNWFQKKMIHWCFGFKVEDFCEEL